MLSYNGIVAFQQLFSVCLKRIFYSQIKFDSNQLSRIDGFLKGKEYFLALHNKDSLDNIATHGAR